MAVPITLDLLGQYLSFTVYPATIIKTSYDKVKLLSVVDAESARLMGFDMQQMHINVFSSIPEAFRPANDHRSYQYVIVELANGTRDCIGIPWITGQEVETHATGTVTLKAHNVSPAHLEKIRRAVASLAIADLEISYSE